MLPCGQQNAEPKRKNFLSYSLADPDCLQNQRHSQQPASLLPWESLSLPLGLLQHELISSFQQTLPGQLATISSHHRRQNWTQLIDLGPILQSEFGHKLLWGKMLFQTVATTMLCGAIMGLCRHCPIGEDDCPSEYKVPWSPDSAEFPKAHRRPKIP